MIIHNVKQNTPEWYAARLGIPTASCFDKIITGEGAESKQADAYQDVLLAEIMAGEPEEMFTSAYMERGKELEAEAAEYYSFIKSVECVEVGFINDDARTIGCSPDRLIGEDGMLEIKVPKASTHVRYMRGIDTDKLVKDYKQQLQGQMLVAERKWVDIISYHSKMKPVIIRVQRDEPYLTAMRRCLAKFNAELEAKKTDLRAKGFME